MSVFLDIFPYILSFAFAPIILWFICKSFFPLCHRTALLCGDSIGHCRVGDIGADISEYFGEYKKISIFLSPVHRTEASSIGFPRFIILGREIFLVNLKIREERDIPTIFSRGDLFTKFIFLHELNHIINRHGFWDFIYSRNLRHELQSDRLGSIFLGKRVAIESLEKLRDLYVFLTSEAPSRDTPDAPPTNHLDHPAVRELDLRIMAIDMPTLFGRYAN